MNQENPNIDQNDQMEADEWEIDNLPNRLTMFRMLLIPIIIGSLLFNLSELSWVANFKKDLGYLAAWTFVLASVTDFFDGYIARKRGIVTVFGSFLDPIADKFLVVSSLILLQALDRVPVVVVIILVLREMYITSLRLLASDKGLQVPVQNLGKWKTATQMVGIPFLMAFDKPWGIPMPLLGTIFIYIAFLLSLWSAGQYSYGLIKSVKAARMAKRELKAHS